MLIHWAWIQTVHLQILIQIITYVSKDSRQYFQTAQVRDSVTKYVNKKPHKQHRWIPTVWGE